MPFALLPISIPVDCTTILVCYEAAALDWIHPANLEPDIEQSCIPVDVLGCNPAHLLVPSLNQAMKAVDVVEMIDPVVVLMGRDHLAVASKSRDQLVVRRAVIIGPDIGFLLDVQLQVHALPSGLLQGGRPGHWRCPSWKKESPVSFPQHAPSSRPCGF